MPCTPDLLTHNHDVVGTASPGWRGHVCRKTAAALRIERSWTIVVKA